MKQLKIDIKQIINRRVNDIKNDATEIFAILDSAEEINEKVIKDIEVCLKSIEMDLFTLKHYIK